MNFKKIKVQWFLSINKKFLKYEPNNKENYIREFNVDGKKIDFTSNFNNLHTESYKLIFKNKGFRITDVEQSIRLVNKIKSIKKIEKLNFSDCHHLLKYI
jgi:UDP-N-acetyl-2-amino-2-deoxyglucuronate dehydrogenase